MPYLVLMKLLTAYSLCAERVAFNARGDILAFQLTEHEATIRYLSAHSWDVAGEG